MLVGVAIAVFSASRLFHGDRIELTNADLFGYYYPTYAATFARLRAGSLPLWNPYQLCGLPWLGTLQTGVLSPLHLAYLFFAPSTAMATTTVVHLVLAAIGTVLLARRIGLGMAPAVLAAALFTCRGHLPRLAYWPASLDGAAWLPIGLLGVLELARGRTRAGATIVAVAASASVLPGNPQMTVFLVYAWTIVLIALLVPPLATSAGRAVLGFAAALGLAALLAGIALVPGMELAADGGRGLRALSVEQMYPMGSALLRSAAIDFVWRAGFTRDELAFGLVGTALLVPALLDGRHRRIALGLLVVGLAAFAFALGPVTPLFALALHLPALAWFRVPEYDLFVVDFAFAMLAAIGLDAVTSGPARRLPVAAAIVAAAALAIASLGGRIELNAPPAVTLVALALFVATAFVPVSGRRWLGPALVACAAIDLGVAPSHGLKFPLPPQAELEFRAAAPLYLQVAETIGHDRFWLFTTGIPASMTGPKVPTLFRARSVDDYEPLNTRRQGEYFVYLWEGASHLTRRSAIFDGYLNTLESPAGRAGPGSRRRLLDLAAVRLVLFPPKTLRRPDVRRFIEDAGLRPRLPIMGMPVWENPSSLPRAYVVYRVASAPPVDELRASLARPDFDPLASSYVEGPVPFTAADDAPARGAAATIEEDGERVVEVEATLARPGLVVLADTFFPGWTATVDGRPAPILATNHLFRGVPAPAGLHRVRFEYRPSSVWVGALASGIGLLGLAAVAAPGLLTRRRSRA